jgi:hypothetical protein
MAFGEKWEGVVFIMKRWKILTLILIALALRNRTASADVFYGATNYEASSYGVVTGEGYSPSGTLFTSAYAFPTALSFTDPDGNDWVASDGYTFGSGVVDTVDIYNLAAAKWDKPDYTRTDWGMNIKGLAIIDNYLYIAAYERLENGVSASGELIRVDMGKGKGFAADKRYEFDPYTENGVSIPRRPSAIKVWNGRIYVLTYTLEGVNSKESEIFVFDGEIDEPLERFLVGGGDVSAWNAQNMALYGDKLYVGSNGGAREDSRSVGGVWEVDLSGESLTGRKIFDCADITDDSFEGKDKGVDGIVTASDGAVFMIVGGYDDSGVFSSNLYVTTVYKLREGDSGSETRDIDGYYPVFDEKLNTLWYMDWNGYLYACGRDGKVRKALSPSDLGDGVSSFAVVGGAPVYVKPKPDDNSGGGCDAGATAASLLLIAAASLVKYRGGPWSLKRFL